MAPVPTDSASDHKVLRYGQKLPRGGLFTAISFRSAFQGTRKKSCT
jgi:hypothetical protein